MKRTPAVSVSVAVAVAAALVLAGCSAGGGAASGKTTLAIEDYYQASYNPVYAACAKEVGVDVKITHVAGAGLIAKVLQQASSKTLPDVLMLDNPDVQQIAKTGALSRLSNYKLNGDGLVKGVIDAGTYKGDLYGLVPVTNSIALYYNSDLLKAAGIEPPKTWDELRAAAKTLTDPSKGQYGFAMSNINTYEGTWQFLPFFWTNGGDEKNIDTSDAAQALQYVLGLQDDGLMSKSSINWAQADVKDQFVAGKAAMMINGPWQLPELNKATKDKGLKFDSVPIPVRTASQKTVAPLGGEAFTVPNTGDKAKMALAGKFVGCLATPTMQKKIAGVTGNVPTNVDAGKAWATSNPQVAAFVTTVQTARARTGELGDKWPVAATAIYTAVQLALTGKAAPAAALKQAQADNK